MSLLRLDLRQNPVTGRHDLVVKLDSDADLTAHEHEMLHKKILAQLIGSGVLERDQLGNWIIERVTASKPEPTCQTNTNPMRSRQAESQE